MQRLGRQENAGSFLLNFPASALVTAGTYALADEAPFPIALTTLRYQVGSAAGSFTVTVNNGGTAVAGMSAVAVSSATRTTAAGTGNLAVAAGARLEIVISAVTGTPAGAALTLNFTRA